MIAVCGEALIDFAPIEISDNRAYLPIPGGSPYNVAIGLGRLGCPVDFIGKLSDDEFGQILRKNLLSNGGRDRFTLSGPEPSTLAFIHIEDDRDPHFSFFSNNSADRNLTTSDLPKCLPSEIQAIHFGSFSLAHEPIASTLEKLIEREHNQRIISIDPNIRPSFVTNKNHYINRLEKLISFATIVKVSTEDISWMYPNQDPNEIISEWIHSGPNLVILTSGAEGSYAESSSGIKSTSPAHPVTIVDTVGAGDSFMSALLWWLSEKKFLNLESMKTLSENDIQNLLLFSNKAASITCGRSGANPPFANEIEMDY
ncbi:MAG: carbohydrate kinase family protein [Dehalococcoidia bacterium]